MKYLRLFEEYVSERLNYEFKCTDCDRDGIFHNTPFGTIDSTEFAQIIDRIEQYPISRETFLEYDVILPEHIDIDNIETFKYKDYVVVYDVESDIHYIYSISRRMNESNEYDNWVRYTDDSLNSDWIEYKKKEIKKWRSRSEDMQFRFPLFETKEEFKNALDTSPIIELTESTVRNVRHATDITDIESLRDMVSTYVRPRDIDRIIQGFENKDSIPMPIILKSKVGMFIMAGNTRQNVARIMGIVPKAILINLDKI